MIRKIIIALILMFFWGGCEHTTEPEKESCDHCDNIVGSWSWLKSFGGYDGIFLTPESVGYTMKIVFGSDKTYSVFKNDSLERESTFVITKEQLFGDEDLEEVLNLKDEIITKQIIQFVGEDTLELREYCDDCFVHTYLRIN